MAGLADLKPGALLPARPARALAAVEAPVGLGILKPSACSDLKGNLAREWQGTGISARERSSGSASMRTADDTTHLVLQVEQMGVGLQKTRLHDRGEEDIRCFGGRRTAVKTSTAGCGRRTGQADGADVADVDDVLVAEAGSPKVDAVL